MTEVRPAVLVADPPWPFKDKLPGRGRGAAKHYKLMTMARLKAYPIPNMADDSVLLMWRVSSMQREALDLIEAWGFILKSEIVWLKRRRCGPCKGIGRVLGATVNGDPLVRRATDCDRCDARGHRQWFGMGRQVRAAHETCLIATRGKGIRIDRSTPSVFEAVAEPKHSKKPERFFEIVEKLYPGPYHELFARRHRPGWTCEGDEAWESATIATAT